jgi:hypothetical protein
LLQILSTDDELPGFLAQLGKSLEPWKHVADFAEEVGNWVSRFGCASDVGSESAVLVMTLQGAKGLEADIRKRIWSAWKSYAAPGGKLSMCLTTAGGTTVG